MDRFDVLSTTHKIEVADHDRGLKYVFNENHRYDGDAHLSIGSLSKVRRTTTRLDITADDIPSISGLQDVPSEVFEFLDQRGYDTEWARTKHQL